jgi:hypothetical protein
MGSDYFGKDRRIRLDGHNLAKIVAVELNAPQFYGDIPAALSPAAGDQGAPLNVPALSAYAFFWTKPDFPIAAMSSYWCSVDRYTLSVGKRLSDVDRPELAGVDDGALEWGCDAWPMAKASAATFVAFPNSIPTLIVEGDLSWYTSPAEIASIESGLTHVSTIHFATLSEDPLGTSAPSCLNRLRRQFLAHPLTHLDTTSCARQSPKIAFVGSH